MQLEELIEAAQQKAAENPHLDSRAREIAKRVVVLLEKEEPNITVAELVLMHYVSLETLLKVHEEAVRHKLRPQTTRAQ